MLDELIQTKGCLTKCDENDTIELNHYVSELYNGWAAFILTQYKTCHRNDTQFWMDHKNVKFDYLDKMMSSLYNDMSIVPNSQIEVLTRDIIAMIQNTVASRNINWKTNTNQIPLKLDDSGYKTINHYEFLANL